MVKAGTNELMDTYKTFSGCDMTAIINMPLSYKGKVINKVYVIGELQTLTYSTSMDRQPIRSISNVNAKDYVMGQRKIAGSMVFSVFDRHFVNRIVKDLNKLYNTGYDMLMDELPPFDINVVMANEYGSNTNLKIYGVRIINEGQVMSINDIYMENTYQYVATGLRYAEPFKGDNMLVSDHKIVSPEDIYKIPMDSKISPERFPFDIYNNPKKFNKDIFPVLNNKIEDVDYVNLMTKKGRWVGKRQEVIFIVSPKREKGEIRIVPEGEEDGFKIDYEGRNIIYALPEGRYKARYEEKYRLSNIRDIHIRKSNLSDNELSDRDEGVIPPKEDNDIPIIDDKDDDSIKVTNPIIYIRDDKENVFKPDEDLYIKGLEPDKEYDVYFDGNKVKVKTDPYKEFMYDKLVENTESKFLNAEKEYNEVILELKGLLQKNEYDLALSIYDLYLIYKINEIDIYMDIIKNLMYMSLSILQRRKVAINMGSKSIPIVSNYSVNRIMIPSNAEYLIIQKLPERDHAPIEIPKSEFIFKNMKFFYEIKDKSDSMYKIYTLDKDNNRSPFIYLFSNIDPNHIIEIDESKKSVTYEDKVREANFAIPEINFFTPPIVKFLNEGRFRLESKDLIGYNDLYICCVDSRYKRDKSKIIKRKHLDGVVEYSNYDIIISDDLLYLSWIEDSHGNILSKILPFTNNDEDNLIYIENLKRDFYRFFIRSEYYKRLSNLEKTLLSMSIEKSDMFITDIKSNFIKELIKSRNDILDYTKNLLIIDKMMFDDLYGVKKKKAFESFKMINKTLIPNDEKLEMYIDVISPVTGEIKSMRRIGKVNVQNYHNKIILVNAIDKERNLVCEPFAIFDYRMEVF